MDATRHKLKYIPALDGLRAIAVLLVMFMHTNPSLAPGGFVGVDVFFVLSGFLITSILIDELEITGTISLRAFYWRRLLRLAPALFAVVLTCIAYDAIFESGEKLWWSMIHAASVIVYVSNWTVLFVSHKLYDPKLVHLWSLSIEEQFYLAWPPLLLLISKLQITRRSIVIIAIVSLSAPLIARNVLWRGPESFAYYFHTEMRIDNLAYGCLSAVLLHVYRPVLLRRRQLILFLAPIAMSVILWHALLPNLLVQPWIYRAGFTVISVCAALTIVGAAAFPDSIIYRLLGTRLLNWVGRISYGLYIWHIPIFWLAQQQNWNPLTQDIFSFLASFAVATASYYVIERPFLRLKQNAAAMATTTNVRNQPTGATAL